MIFYIPEIINFSQTLRRNSNQNPKHISFPKPNPFSASLSQVWALGFFGPHYPEFKCNYVIISDELVM